MKAPTRRITTAAEPTPMPAAAPGLMPWLPPLLAPPVDDVEALVVDEVGVGVGFGVLFTEVND